MVEHGEVLVGGSSRPCKAHTVRNVSVGGACAATPACRAAEGGHMTSSSDLPVQERAGPAGA